MAGKADLVNSIVDRVEGITPNSADVADDGGSDWGYASLLDTPPPDGSVRIGPGGGGQGG